MHFLPQLWSTFFRDKVSKQENRIMRFEEAYHSCAQHGPALLVRCGPRRALRVQGPRLAAWCEVLRLSDRAGLAAAAAGEELRPAVLEDRAATLDLLQDVDASSRRSGMGRSPHRAQGSSLQSTRKTMRMTS